MARRVTTIALLADISAAVRGLRTTGSEAEGAQRKVSSLERELEKLSRTRYDPSVVISDRDAQNRLRDLTAKLDALARKTADARVTVNDAGAQSKLSRVEASLLALGQKTADPNIDLHGIADAEVKLGALEAQLSEFDHNDYVASVRVDGTARASRSASLLVDSVAMLGPAAVAAGGAASGAVLGLGAAMGTAIVPAGLLGVTISEQVKQMKAAEKQIQTDTQKLAGLTKGTAEYAAQQKLVNSEVADFKQQFGDLPALLDKAKAAGGDFLTATGQGGVNTLIGDALKLWIRLLPQFEGLVEQAAGSVDDLLGGIADFARSPDARALIAFFETRGPAAVEAFGAVAGNTGKGLLSLFLAFAPLEGDMLGGLQRVTAEFARWAAQVGQTQGFEDFLAYVRTEGPKVWDLLGSLAQALLAIGQAAAPVGAVTLPVIKSLADILTLIAKSPAGPVIVGAALALSTLNRALRTTEAIRASHVMVALAGPVKTVGTESEQAAGSVSRLTAKSVALKGAFLGLGIGAEVLASHLDSSHESLKAILTIGGGALAGAAFGPEGAAAGAAAGALALFSQRSQEAAQYQQQLDSAAQSVADTLDQQTGAVTRATVAATQKQLADQGAYDDAKSLGISYDLVTRAVLGNKGAQDQLTAAAQRAWHQSGSNEAAVLSLQGIFKSFSDTLDTNRAHIEQQQRAIAEAELATHPWRTSLAQTSKVMAQMGPEFSRISAGATGVVATSKPLESAWQRQVDILKDAATSADQYKAALDRLINTNGDTYDSQRAITQGYLDMQAAIKSNGTSLSDQTTKGNANIDMLKSQVENIKTLLEAQKQAGRGPEFLAKSLQAQTRAMVANFVQMGFSKQRVEELLHVYGLTPKLITTLLKVDNGDANKKIDDTQGKADHLGATKPNLFVTADTHNANSALEDTQNRADFLDHTRPVVTVASDTSPAINALQRFQQSAESTLGAIGRHPYYIHFELDAQANKVMQELGGIPNADGNLLNFANGGSLPSIGAQWPQIQPNRGPRGIRWAETGAGPWEAFISGHPAKRERSKVIATETVHRLGGDVRFADGGILANATPDLVVQADMSGLGAAAAAMEGMFNAIAARAGAVLSREVEAAIHKAAVAAAKAAAAVGSTYQGSGGAWGAIHSAADQFGWGSGLEWADLVKIINSESGGNPNAQNPTSTAYGIYQFLDGTWAGVGGHKTSDPYLQSIYGDRYIKARYGDPIGAWAFHVSHGWYDRGGAVPPGDTLVHNGLGHAETILPYEPKVVMQAMSGGVDQALVGAVNAMAKEIATLRARLDRPITTDVRRLPDISGQVAGVAQETYRQNGYFEAGVAGMAR